MDTKHRLKRMIDVQYDSIEVAIASSRDSSAVNALVNGLKTYTAILKDIEESELAQARKAYYESKVH